MDAVANAAVYLIALVGGAVCAIGATMYLYLYIGVGGLGFGGAGVVPFPASALLFGAALAWITACCVRLRGPAWVPALPVIGFFVVVAAFLLGGPGRSVMYTDWRLLVIVFCGIALPWMAANLASSDR